MESKFVKISDKREWQDLLGKVFFKTFFHYEGWEDFLEKNFKWLEFERYKYKDRALLSLARAKGKLVSHPFCEYGGPLPLKEKIDFEEFKKDLLSEFKEPLSVSFHPRLSEYFQGLEGSAESLSNSAYFIEGLDSKNSSEIFNSFRKTLRHSLKKALDSGLQVSECRDKKELGEFYKIYLKTEKRHCSVPYPFSFFEYFFDSSSAEVILARYKERIVAGSCFLFYGDLIHYSKNASLEKYRDLNANYLILWHQLEKHSGGRYRFLDLGGTGKNSQLAVFKRGWGSREYPIFELKNRQDSGKSRAGKMKLRKALCLIPPFLSRKLSNYLLKYRM